MNKQVKSPIQETIAWLRTQVELTVLNLKKAKVLKDKQKIKFYETRLVDLARRILHVDAEIDKLQPVI